MSATRSRSTPPKGLVPAVARAARLLEALAAASAPVPLAELTTRLSLPKSTVHGLAATLVHAGLADRDDAGAYRLGVRIMDLAHAFVARTDLAAEFVRIVERGAPLPEESLVLSVLDGADIVYVACRNGTRPFGFAFRVGMRLPANCAASGKALLASLPDERIADLAKARAFYGLTRRSVVELAPLRRELARVRRRGYAFDDEETRESMVCVGAPVFDSPTGPAAAAVGISLPKSAMTAERRDQAIRAVRDVAAALSARLGAASRADPASNAPPIG